jgi:ribonucleoside-diphosphate reductase alpha chain
MLQKTNLTDNSRKVLERRYLIRNQRGEVIEKPQELFLRVAKAIAAPEEKFGADPSEIEKVTEQFFGMMASLEFLPNSPTLMNAGRPLGQLSACFVLPIEDSMDSIFEAVKNTALIHKSGGGTGFSFSRLRPKNSMVASTSGVASGPVSFMKVINAATEAVKQGGTRRGANMGVLRVDHPDIVEFITSKDNLSELTNFNISVAIPDDFMEAVEENREYPLIDPRTGKEYFLEGKPVRLNAQEVFEMIVEHAWKSAEPGVMFIDRMNAGNPVKKVALYEATNPCGEQPLLPYDSCNLGSINLALMLQAVVDPQNPQTPYRHEVDWEKLKKTVRTAVHFLDNVIEANKYPIPEIEAETRKNRKIGLGVMGWADMLFQLGIPYDSEAALSLMEKVMSFIQEEGYRASEELAEVRGSFPRWEKSFFYDEKTKSGRKMRNSTVTTIAPTGTISIIAGCSSGVEPAFAICFTRTVMGGTELVEVNPIFEQKAKEVGFYSKDLFKKIAEKGSVAEIEEIPEEIRRVFVSAHDISPEWHVRMQAASQKYTDNAVSKTINLPRGATVEDVASAYKLAFRSGCKGITVYRDGSRAEQVLSTKQARKKKERAVVKERPERLGGITEKIRTGYGNLYVTINTLGEQPFEVFAQIGKSGYTTMADTEAICRLVSLSLRSGVDVNEIIEQLEDIGGASPVYQKGGLIMSIPDAIAKVLKSHFGSNDRLRRNRNSYYDICPDCGGRVEHAGGCEVCHGCGFSKC